MFQKHENLLIRPMMNVDIDVIAHFFCPPWSSPTEITRLWKNYYQQQQNNIRTVGIVVKNNQIVGYGSLFRQSECPYFSNVPEINNVWIHEKNRKCGLGTQLIEWLENLAKEEGYKQIGIGVGLYKDYGPAQKLYIKLGYKPDGNGITYKCTPTIPGQTYLLDDDLILWLTKSI